MPFDNVSTLHRPVLSRLSVEPFFARLLREVRWGCLRVRLPSGQLLQGQGTHHPNTVGELSIRRPWRLMARIMSRGMVGFAEGYLHGDWDTEDLRALLHVGARNRAMLSGRFRTPGAVKLIRRFRHRTRRNTPRGSQRNIAEHYDLGNAFYRAWLDPSMTYSSAIFDDAGGDLEAAQETKYATILDRLAAQPGQRILEIGCGWGGFAIAAAQRGLYVVGLTLSREQLEEAQQRVAAAGVADRVELRLQDYRSVDETFDHIVSIEMFEAVGLDYWDTYFRTLARCLRPGGRVALQIITIAEDEFPSYCTCPDFIQLYVFPGGMLPPESALTEQASRSDLALVAPRFWGEHYARTLAEWSRRFEAALPRIRSLGYDDYFARLWRFYLAYCEAGFRVGRINLLQATLERRAAGHDWGDSLGRRQEPISSSV